MANEHNGNLIARLYAATERDSAIRVLEEMDEIKDPSFIAPILVAFERFKDSSISHYFLSSLKKYSSPQVKKLFIKIVTDTTTSNTNFVWALDSLPEIEYEDDTVTQRTESYLHGDDFAPHELLAIVEYLKFAKRLEENSDPLLRIIKKESFKKDTRKLAIRILLELNASVYLQHFLDDFNELRDTNSDYILAEVLISWKGSLVTKLEDEILKNGNDRSKEIINDKRQKKAAVAKKEEIQKAESTVIEYPNSDVIARIFELRSRINILTLSDDDFKSSLFKELTILIKQTRPANSDTELSAFALDLRAFLQSFSKNTKNHGISYEAASKIIPNTSEPDMLSPLNQFHLFMVSKGRSIAGNLFGLRELNLLTNKIAHPEDQEGLIKALTTNNLLRLYQEENWQALHRSLLESYMDSLISIEKSL